jgi:hypothetical protein
MDDNRDVTSFNATQVVVAGIPPTPLPQLVAACQAVALDPTSTNIQVMAQKLAQWALTVT